MKISTIRAHPFPPFTGFEIGFPHTGEGGPEGLAEVHVFTGPNGSGKTRLLALIAASLGGMRELAKRGLDREEFTRFAVTIKTDRGNAGGFRDLRHDALIGKQQTPAMTLCPRAFLEKAELTLNEEIRRPTIEEALAFSRSQAESERLLQAFFTIDMQAAMEGRQGADGRFSRMIKAIEQAVQEVMGRPFAFASTVHPKAELRVRWGGEPESYEISCLPDGLRSILGWLVQAAVWMEMFWADSPDPLDQPVILLVDEPETNLNPAWQLHVMPMMQRLFPNAQIFVATHSPFIVSSLNENTWIHHLKVGANGVVTIEDPRAPGRDDTLMSALNFLLEGGDGSDTQDLRLRQKFRA